MALAIHFFIPCEVDVQTQESLSSAGSDSFWSIKTHLFDCHPQGGHFAPFVLYWTRLTSKKAPSSCFPAAGMGLFLFVNTGVCAGFSLLFPVCEQCALVKHMLGLASGALDVARLLDVDVWLDAHKGNDAVVEWFDERHLFGWVG